MRTCAAYAGFDPVFHNEVPSALFFKKIQWAITEETVELILVYPLMTGKVFTVFITEKS